MSSALLATIFSLAIAWAAGPPASEAPPQDPIAVARKARQLLERFRHEPTVRETQAAAVRHAAIDAARLASWRRRSRIAAAAPELLAEYRRASGNDRTLGEQSSGTVDYSGLDLEDRYTVRARWQFDRLVFNPDELRVAAESIDAVELRQTVVDQATRLYFERRRQQVLLLGEVLDLDSRLKLELRVEELTASLDGLTGGWFSGRLAGAGVKDPGRDR